MSLQDKIKNAEETMWPMTMGMTIDDADTILSCERLDSSMECGASDEDIDKALGVAIDTMRKYQMFQDQSLSLYMERLKADMVAMLEDLDLQIDESAAYNLEVAKVQRLIRDKINVLKENKDGTTSD